MNAQQKQQLAELGIKAATIEDAKAIMIKRLDSFGVAGVEDEDFDNLVMFCLAFQDEEVPAKATPADHAENLSREVQNEDDAKADEKIAANLQEDDDDEEEIIVKKKPTPAPAKPAPVSKAAPAPKAAPATKSATPAPKKAVAVSLTSTKFNPREVPEHIAGIEFLKQFFPSEEVQYDPLKQGVTLRALLANTRPTVLNFDEVRFEADGSVSGNVYFNKFKSVEDLLAFLPAGFEETHKIGMFRGESHPSVKSLTQAEIVGIFTDTDIVNEINRRVGKLDAKMAANREQMQNVLKSNAQTQTAAKKK